MSSLDSVNVRSGWSARIELDVEQSGQASVLGRRVHSGPLRVQRPFYPEGPAWPHVYLLHPPGGLVGGDALQTRIRVRERASALFTTPAAQKLYRCPGPSSSQRNDIDVLEGAALEWFPAETIAFDGARSTSATRVVLAPQARFFGWEIVCFGRTAGALPYRSGEVSSCFEIHRGTEPLSIDRSIVKGGSDTLEAAWGYSGLPVFGALYAVPARSSDVSGLVDLVRERVAVFERAAVSGLDQLLVVRASATHIEPVRALFRSAWDCLRPAVMGRTAVAPRIWAV